MFHVPEQYRIRGGKLESDASYGNNGAFKLPILNSETKAPEIIMVIASDQLGWEHVSVSMVTAKASNSILTPTWDQMCEVKDLFWDPEDCVIQYHPPKSQYVNIHPGVLHLWRPVYSDIPIPPKKLV